MEQQDTRPSLQDGAQALATAGAQARAWIGRVAQTAASVANEEHALADDTRRAENLARKLAASSARRNSAGVFGPSQAGKSYLVSALGRGKDRPLLADFAGTTRNFIREINPEGGKESTGLVTRFTVVKGSSDASHPVELRLLTECDLVKIIGNSFLSDFDQHNRRLGLPGEEDVRATLARLEAAAAARSAAHLDEIALFDIGEYFRANFATTIGPLSRAGYWDALTRFGHRLPRAARTELYALLWGRAQALTDVFELLQGALEALGHPATARAAIDCLVPRTRSIIDVEILKQHLGMPEDQRDTLAVVPERADGGDGAPCRVARATLCALVAEIKVVMAERPWPFFEHTDLLDFPGARAREQMVDLPADAAERAVSVRNMLLRGKIAYLFQRYTEERELTCMLLCMPPSNQEVKDLTSLVGKWVAQTHGATPQARAQLPCALFFVLTKFDLELLGKPGDTPESWASRIDTRLEASMYQLYKQEEWLQDWDGRPFANTYFLRNPDYELEAVFQYGPADAVGARHEIGIAPQAAERIAANRRGMLASERCRRHFADPAAAWDAALALDDGGVSRLVGQLERVLSPQLKPRQLAGRLVDQAAQLDLRLRRYYRSDDDDSRKEKEAALMALRRRLYKAASERAFRNFTQLLARMKVAEADVRGVFLNVAALRLDAAPPTEAAAAAQPEPDPWDDPWAEPPPAAAGGRPAAALPAPRRQRDRADHFATQVFGLWSERVRGIAGDATVVAALGMDASLVSDIADELVVGAQRNGVIERIAERVRAQVAAANVRWDEMADRSAGIAAMLINDFVFHLGFGDLPPDARPAVPEAPKPRLRGVFAAPPLPARGEAPRLGAQPAQLVRDYFLDWGVALRQLGLDNVSYAGGREIGEADNRALGDILRTLAPALRVAAP